MRKAAILNWALYTLVRRRRQQARTAKWAVGIYKPDRLGDFILSLGAIRSIVERAGPANCVILHSPLGAEIAGREFPHVDRIQLPPLDEQLWATHRKMRKLTAERFESAGIGQLLCLRHFRTISDEMVMQMIPTAEIWCVGNSPIAKSSDEIIRRRFAGDVDVSRPFAGSQSAGQCEDLACHAELLAAWSRTTRANVDVEPRIVARGPARENVLVVVPFGSDRLRDLPVETVAACIIHARKARGIGSVVLSPPHAVARYQSFAAELARRGAVVEVRVTGTCDDLINAIAGSTAILTTETATAHIASALDHPMVCLIGGGHFGLFGPWWRSSRQAWIFNRIGCYDCSWHCVQSGPICITEIPVREVLQAVESALGLGQQMPHQAKA